MQAGLAGFAGVPGRLQRLHCASGSLVIDDTYNANPESMKAAVSVLSQERARKVFVMGDMAGLGAAAPAMDAQGGRLAQAAGAAGPPPPGGGARRAGAGVAPG